MGRQHNYFVYILRCSDGSYYVGVTNHVEYRFRQHQEGEHPGSYTYWRRPLELVYVERYQWIQQAIAREKQIKRWTRKKKEALIAGDEQLLSFHALAYSRQAGANGGSGHGSTGSP